MSEADRLKFLASLAGHDHLAPFARDAGVPEGTAQKHVSRNSIPKGAATLYVEAARKAGISNVTEDWLIYGKGPAPKLHQHAEPREPREEKHGNVEVRRFDIAVDALIPLWKAVGTDGMAAGATMHLARALDDSVLGPDHLRHIKSAFAVKVWDDRNAPWLNSGALVFTDRSPPRVNDWALFGKSETDGGLGDATVGVFLRRTEAGWHIQIGNNKIVLPLGAHRVAWRIVHITP